MNNEPATRCSECNGIPRRLSMPMDGRLFCQRSCYIAFCARIWDQEFNETFAPKPKSDNVTEFKKGAKK